MRNEDDGSATEEVAFEALINDPSGSMHVESTKHIIQQDDLGLRKWLQFESRDRRRLKVTCVTVHRAGQ